MTNRLRYAETLPSSVEERKANMRLYMKRRRAENENRDEKERLLAERFLRLVDTELAKTQGAGTRLTVFTYLSYSSEAATDELVRACSARGYTVLAPRVENGDMYAVPIGDDFTLSPLGIREPIGRAYGRAPDIVVLPCLAVDERGNRLGYGGGYYDRYLKKYPTARRVAYAYDFQIVDETPHTLDDERVEYIVTERRTIRCTANEN